MPWLLLFLLGKGYNDKSMIVCTVRVLKRQVTRRQKREKRAVFVCLRGASGRWPTGTGKRQFLLVPHLDALAFENHQNHQALL